MASSLLSKEQFLCPICLEVFNQPVSTPCGHNFCMSCITSYWDDTSVCECPVCKEIFKKKPDLKVNAFISQLASQFMSLHVTDAHFAPFAILEDRNCEVHNRLLTLFCRSDGVFLCDGCVSSDHMSPDIVPVQQEYEEKKAQLRDAEARVQWMIQERLQKVRAVNESVEQSKTETKDVIANSMQDLTALVSEIQKSQTELVKVMEEKQKAAEERADRCISSMEKEITELQRTMMLLKELKQTEDPLCFLQRFPNSFILPDMMNLSTVSFNRLKEIHNIRKSLNNSVSQLQMLLTKMNTDIQKLSDVSNDVTLRYTQQYEVDVVLDPDTAHPQLFLSDDMKQVRYCKSSRLRKNLNPNPKMFNAHLAVLGQRGFSSQRFYFEVFVGGKTEWCLGVAKASIQRRGVIVKGPRCGIWAIRFQKDKFETFIAPNVTVFFGKVERVGVFVDYEGGQISFYNVQTATLIYSFTDCVFTEELLPYFNPCDNEFGSNLEPIIIVPVSQTYCTEV